MAEQKIKKVSWIKPVQSAWRADMSDHSYRWRDQACSDDVESIVEKGNFIVVVVNDQTLNKRVKFKVPMTNVAVIVYEGEAPAAGK
jgi:hypothetical protein